MFNGISFISLRLFLNRQLHMIMKSFFAAGAIITENNLSIKAKPSLRNKYSDGYR
jgi:hypothetical protein